MFKILAPFTAVNKLLQGEQKPTGSLVLLEVHKLMSTMRNLKKEYANDDWILELLDALMEKVRCILSRQL